MKKIGVLILVVILMAVPACHSAEKETVVSGFDLNAWMKGISNICRGENGYYAISDDQNMIYTIDDEEGTAVPLCSKAECTHDTEDCNAYLGRSVLGWTIWYDGTHLYVVAARAATCYLYEISLDGSGSREICALFKTTGASAYGLSPYYYDGYLYYAQMLQSATDVANGIYAQKLYRIRIENNAKPELICENTENVDSVSSNIGRCFFYEDLMYFVLSCYANDGSSEATTLYRYHTKEDKLEKLGERYMAYYCVVDDVLYYTAENGIHQYNLNDGTEVMFYEDPALVSELIYDGQYFYASDKGYIRATEEESPDFYTMYVIDREGDLVDTIAIDWTWSFFYGDGNNLVAKGRRDLLEKEQSATQFYFYDKRQIGTDQDEWKMVEIVRDWN